MSEARVSAQNKEKFEGAAVWSLGGADGARGAQ
jgi:hypothetical protein